MSKYDVAIIVGCYKQEKYVRQGVWSARNQIVPPWAHRTYTLPNYTVIESHDNCDSFGSGAASHRNRAIEKVDADWIIWLDADDLLNSCYLYSMWQGLEEGKFHPRTIIAAPVQFVSGCRLDLFPSLHIDREIWPFAMSGIFSKEAWNACGGFNQHMAPLEDWDFWLRAGICVGVAPRALMMKRDHPISHLKSKSEEEQKLLLKVFNEVHNLKLDSIFQPYFVPQTDII